MSWVAAAVAGGTILGGYMSSKSQKDAANTAAAASTESSQLGIDEQRRQFDIATDERRKQFEQLQALLKPFTDAGVSSLGAQKDLLGLNGTGPQGAAIDAIKASPQFGAITQQGEDAILANASATGGLRGGNVQAALAQFRPTVLSQLIDQQYARLGGITSTGENAAAFTGNAGVQTGDGIARSAQNTGDVITKLLGQQGSAAAGAALAAGRADSQFTNTLTGAFGTFMGSKF